MHLLTLGRKDVGKRVSKRINTALRRQVPPKSRADLIDDLIELHQNKPDFSETYLKRMVITNFGAGHETLASTLTSVLSLLGSHQNVHKTVVEEVRAHSASTSYAVAAKLPLMQAAIKEAKRLRPVIGMALPRRVPKGGLHMHGKLYPAGITVGCNPTALHRNEDICGSNPGRYDPARWLDPAAAKDMDTYSLSWGGGSRTCPGRHLAELMVFKIISALILHFDITTSVPPEESMPSYFMSMPTGVKVKFVSQQAVVSAIPGS